MAGSEPGPKQTEQILREEAEAIHGADKVRSAEQEVCSTGEAATFTEEEILYRVLNRLNSAALCLSGGGIRSAAFALGVIQALAANPRCISRSADGDEVPEPERSLLGQFHYLSTVSGGGYIGSWLSAWRARSDFRTVWENLIGRPAGPDIEPPAIAWLRSYSSYLTARSGITSPDAWTALAQYIGNLILNWLIILPVFCVPILLLKILAVSLDSVMLIGDWLPDRILPIEDRCAINWQPYLAFAIAGSACLIVALAFLTRARPSRRLETSGGARTSRASVKPKTFVLGFLVWSVLSAIALAQLVGSDPLSRWFARLDAGCGSATVAIVPTSAIPGVVLLLAGALPAALLYAIAWIVAWPPKREFLDLLFWSVSGLVYGALVALGFHLYWLVPALAAAHPSTPFVNSPAIYLTFWVPWMLCSQLAAQFVFTGLISYQAKFSADQEWLGRTAGCILALAIAWLLISYLTFADLLHLPSWFDDFLRKYLVPAGMVSGIVTAVVGMGTATHVAPMKKTLLSRMADIVLAVAAPLFVAGLIYFLSMTLDRLLLSKGLFEEFSMMSVTSLASPSPDFTFATVWYRLLFWLLLGLLISVVLGLVASLCININRFSLHALYRNRLIRAFLGASRLRNPDVFTGFDEADNPRMHMLWPPKPGSGRQPFHVINMTLNLVSSKKLAWQERKAASFTVSPLHCGTGSRSQQHDTDRGVEEIPIGAYRRSVDYGGRGRDPANSGISLGTAMAISGAAASPNMGYHSSSGIAFLMTMFNVRLGWWLGNPGKEGEQTYTHDGPAMAIAPLLEEALGLTTDDSKYIYLSDGGHFENLGLYEMVRRRCRFIVVVDAGCDETFAFQDLGNAVRKIEIDFGIRISFRALEKLERRPIDGRDLGPGRDYHAIGTIHYAAADRASQNGVILYLKAGYHGIESAGIRSYAMANPDFPHQSTMDQWFNESQLESYRALGFEITEHALGKALREETCRPAPSLEDILTFLAKTASSAGSERETVQAEGKVRPPRRARPVTHPRSQ